MPILTHEAYNRIIGWRNGIQGPGGHASTCTDLAPQRTPEALQYALTGETIDLLIKACERLQRYNGPNWLGVCTQSAREALAAVDSDLRAALPPASVTYLKEEE